MPLLDHFHPPLSLRRDWHAFHNAWASTIAFDLNTGLPEGFFAEPNVQFGVEIDVATFEESEAAMSGVASAWGASRASWSAPAPTLTMPLPVLSDRVEVLVYDRSSGPNLVAAIELVSPSNKDRPAQREAFVSKCATYLQGGLGLIVVDVVTDRRAVLHDDLIRRLGGGSPSTWGAGALSAVSYRPAARDGQPWLESWEERLAVGDKLPTLPLALRAGPTLPLDLARSYERTCRELRLAPSPTQPGPEPR
jgi:hypothetical protein